MVFVDNVRQEPGSGKSYTLAVDGSGLLKELLLTQTNMGKFMLLAHLCFKSGVTSGVLTVYKSIFR